MTFLGRINHIIQNSNPFQFVNNFVIQYQFSNTSFYFLMLFTCSFCAGNLPLLSLASWFNLVPQRAEHFGHCCFNVRIECKIKFVSRSWTVLLVHHNMPTSSQWVGYLSETPVYQWCVQVLVSYEGKNEGTFCKSKSVNLEF